MRWGVLPNLIMRDRGPGASAVSGSTFVELSELPKSCWWGKRDVGGMESSSAVGARNQAEARREGARAGRQDSGVRAAHRRFFLVLFNVRHLNNCQVC